jgi:Zn-dependent peptidase ImmA (M78 family)
MAVIKKHQQAGAPVNVVSIARELGLYVWKIDTLPAHVSGMIKKEVEGVEKGKYSIYVNSAHSTVRRRFTIAHEMAHFILHFEDVGDGIFDDALYRSGLSSEKELEANSLAVSILMPWELLSEEIAKLGTTNVNVLAERFQVSKQAVAIRLDNVGEYGLYSAVYSKE